MQPYRSPIQWDHLRDLARVANLIANDVCVPGAFADVSAIVYSDDNITVVVVDDLRQEQPCQMICTVEVYEDCTVFVPIMAGPRQDDLIIPRWTYKRNDAGTGFDPVETDLSAFAPGSLYSVYPGAPGRGVIRYVITSVTEEGVRAICLRNTIREVV